MRNYKTLKFLDQLKLPDIFFVAQKDGDLNFNMLLVLLYKL